MGIHSDWGDWLPQHFAGATPDGMAIWYLGCNGFAIVGESGTTIFIDPYLGTGDPPRTVRMIPVPFDPGDVERADAVLATHEHTDHVHAPSQAPILEGTGASFYAPDRSVDKALEIESWTDDYEITAAQFRTAEEGDSLTIGEFEVHVEPANDPDAEHPVSYVIEHDSGTFFHGGDSKPSDDFASIADRYDVDIAALAFGSVGMVPDKRTREPERTRWYNDENEIIEAASSLQVDALLPTHWDMWKGLTADPTGLHEHARSFEYPGSIRIVEIGDRVDLPL
ncbi:MAG: MBL fold metallo-hydrolase [Halanaeroarchaeum sp.]